MDYNFNEIEKKWQQYWIDNKTYKVAEDSNKPKFYVLNMFPYPSGAGLHVGHPLGYIASDIYARFKRLQGFNVLNPMGYDAYGLPAEQYAIQTGQHPEKTTNDNINRYREQLDKIGFCFDRDREVRTCAPGYYHWTQWAFQKMFNSYYDAEKDQARPISELIEKLEQDPAWAAMSEKEKEEDGACPRNSRKTVAIRAVNSNASRLRVLWQIIRGYYCWMSRLVRWMLLSGSACRRN